MAHEIAPDDQIGAMNLADTYRRLGDTAKAERHFQQVLAAKPNEAIREMAESALREMKKRRQPVAVCATVSAGL